MDINKRKSRLSVFLFPSFLAHQRLVHYAAREIVSTQDARREERSLHDAVSVVLLVFQLVAVVDCVNSCRGGVVDGMTRASRGGICLHRVRLVPVIGVHIRPVPRRPRGILRRREVGLALFTSRYFAVKTRLHWMTAGMVRVTDLTPGSDDPTAASKASANHCAPGLR
jgi:hypothetical protein